MAIMVAYGMTLLAQTTSAPPATPDLPDLLVSRQLLEHQALAVGDVVQLAAPDAGAAARPFRVVGVYEPIPDPFRITGRRLEAHLHLPDLIALTADPADPLSAESVTTMNVALVDPADAAAFAQDLDRRVPLTVVGSTPGRHAGWQLVEGKDLNEATGPLPPVVVSRSVLSRTGAAVGLMATTQVGDTLRLRGDCLEGVSVVPTVEFEIVGVAELPFEAEARRTAAVSSRHLAKLCGEADSDEADVLLVASRPEHGTEVTARVVAEALPELYAFSNRELLDGFHRLGFSYFRQISTVLATVTLLFGFLLITSLLTVSVNQRVAEIATLRAMGFPRRRIVTDLVYESAMLVGTGDLLALPLGCALALVLDDILRSMPGLPPDLHVFVFETRAVAVHAGLLALTAALAALYPARLATRLPIAATLRDEVVS